mmetsp:Transcript_3162/g.6774  ORF Transcript_3162/g.6774 Transcript_3162/m.6774 type:complete len:473 (-) Transcript_3162:2725-4143(-)
MIEDTTTILIESILDNAVNNRELLATAMYANSRSNDFVNNTTVNTLVPVMTASQQQQQQPSTTTTAVPLQTFIAPNAIRQPILVQQIPVSPPQQQIINTVQPMPIPTVQVPVGPTEALKQSLFVQQHQHQMQQLQQQLQLEQLQHVQQQQYQQQQQQQIQYPTVTPPQEINTLQPASNPDLQIPVGPTEALQQSLFVQQHEQQMRQLQQQLQLQQLQQFRQQYQRQQQLQYPVVTLPQQIQVVPSPVQTIHNLIPEHLQSFALAASMDGTSGYAPALILPKNNNQNYVNAVNNMILLAAATSSSSNDAAAVAAATQLNAALLAAPQLIPQQQQPIVSIPLTVQDRPSIIPSVFNGVNLAYPGVEALGVDPPIYLVHDFLTHAECDFLVGMADGVWQPAPVVGKGVGEISPSRTSSTCFLAREDLPDYMRKISTLTSKPVDHCELPQVGRYLPTQQYRHVRNVIFNARVYLVL